MNLWMHRIVKLQGNEGTESIFDVMARLALTPPSSGSMFYKTADALATSSSDPAASGSGSTSVPVPASPSTDVLSSPSVGVAITPSSDTQESDILEPLIAGLRPSYRQGANSEVYAVYSLPQSASSKLLSEIITDPRERYSILASAADQPALLSYESPSGASWQVYVGRNGQVKLARPLQDEEYANITPRDVRSAATRVVTPMMDQGSGAAGDPFLAILPMMFQMMMMSDPYSARMMMMQRMMQQRMMQQMMMQQMFAALAQQNQMYGRRF